MSGEEGLEIREVTGAVRFSVRVQPRASRLEVAGVADGALRVRLTAAPTEGSANRQLLKLLASLLKVPKSGLALVSGHRSRSKVVEVRGPGAALVRSRLETCLGQ